MPIPDDTLLTGFQYVYASDLLGDAVSLMPSNRDERRQMYLIIDMEDDTLVVVRWDEVEQIALAGTMPDMLDTPVGKLAGLPTPSAAVEQHATTPAEAETLRAEQPNGRLVVMAKRQPVGLLAADPPVAHAAPPDPFEKFFRDVSYSVDSGETLPDTRVINVWLDGHKQEVVLEVGVSYDLCFNVDQPRHDAQLTIDAVSTLVKQMEPDQYEIEVLIVLESDDVLIAGEGEQTLIVPRTGSSPNIVRFGFTPQHDGRATIKALLIVNNRVFQKQTITFQVGAAAPQVPAIKRSGIDLASALAQPQPSKLEPINLIIIKRDAGYQFILQWSGVTRAFLNLSETQVAELIAYARNALKQIVYRKTGNTLVYQSDRTTIPAEEHAASLKALARTGYYLYQKVFFSPGSSADAQSMGRLLRQISQQHQLHIRIASERFIFPWALLYDRDPLDLNTIDPEGFWGFKHIVEYAPEFSSATPISFSPTITVQGSLSLGFVCNTEIDKQLRWPIVAGQQEALSQLPGVTLSAYPNTQDLFDLMGNSEMPAQVLYFYCHAESMLPGERGGVGESRLILSDGAVQLDELNIFAPTSNPPFKTAPLIFINACQSAELSPYLYDGLVPYLIARGARGVIGTEMDTPAFFAAEFARQFLQRFLAGGEPLGQILLDLRRTYLFEKNNVMGLAYALYSSGDLVIKRS